MSQRSVGVLGALALLGTALTVRASPAGFDDLMRWGGPRSDPIIDQQPHPYGGFGSDTAFRDYFGFPVWQRIADAVLLDDQATVRRIVWWGFYGGSFDEYPEPAPSTETMRIRFYHARPGDDLPDEDNMVYEQSFMNPSRTATGRIVFVGASPPEYRYQVDLSAAVVLEPDVRYWIEIIQVGELESHFRWEFGYGQPGPMASINANVGDWHYTGGNANNGLQLWTVPEPAPSAVLGGMVMCMTLSRFSRGERGMGAKRTGRCSRLQGLPRTYGQV